MLAFAAKIADDKSDLKLIDQFDNSHVLLHF